MSEETCDKCQKPLKGSAMVEGCKCYPNDQETQEWMNAPLGTPKLNPEQTAIFWSNKYDEMSEKFYSCHERAVKAECYAASLQSRISELESEVGRLREAISPVAEEIRNTGNHYKESDWNPYAHIQKPITLTIKEARKILALTRQDKKEGEC